MTSPPHVFQVGERCRLRCDGRELEAEVVLASGNGVSLAVSFEGIVRGFVGMLPALWSHQEGRFVDFSGEPVELTPGGEP